MNDAAGLFASFFAWVQSGRVATAISGSLPLTAALSAVHLIGFTLIMGAALVSHLRLLGVLFAPLPLREVTRPAGRAIAFGLVLSVVTGLLLFVARASTASENGIFQLKMLLLVAAAGFQFGFHRHVTSRDVSPIGLQRLTGAMGLALWFGVGLAGSAFILLE
jgi:hypothetical protein